MVCPLFFVSLLFAEIPPELTARRPLGIVPVQASHETRRPREKKMSNMLAVLAGALMSAVWLMPAALAQTACVTQNMAVPPGANTSDKAAPFFIDTTGPRLQDRAADARSRRTRTIRARPSCPTARCRRPAPRAISSSGRRTRPRPRRSPKDGVPRGTITSFTISSKDSVIYNPGLIRDDVAGLRQQLDHDHDDGAGRQVEHDRHHQPSRHLDAHDRRLCARRIMCAAPRRRSS